ncbi:glycosyltransferase [Hymenobacter sp. HSC-4F20]|uniref:glycosyltransferase n=1 Tax=Hymenobacter sp. HSC-4F20 TaxID=2864135 RepID=UPI001C732DE0|nr:glycosyltransferase [Hymenobacter sp. HSC-4F20]MBX0292139.1 glycosyltransferase [Hymenobacter sp. HSC-4F20]
MEKVSVCCISYNHERYLAQAIESVLMQQTAFDVELIIGEDCSTDNTRQIALDYARRYPEQIRVLLPERNQGVMKNLMATMDACNGTYIAFLEGDDYWTDPHKLQRQVEALRAHPECTLCAHDAQVLSEDGTSNNYIFSNQFRHVLPLTEGIITHDKLVAHHWFIPSASMLFVKVALTLPLPAWFAEVHSGDYTLQLLATRTGSIYYLPDAMSVYRRHATSLTHSTHRSLEQNRKRIFENQQHRAMMPKHYSRFFESYLEHLYFERSELQAANGNKLAQLYYYAKAISVNKERLAFHISRLTKRFTQ